MVHRRSQHVRATPWVWGLFYASSYYLAGSRGVCHAWTTGAVSNQRLWAASSVRQAYESDLPTELPVNTDTEKLGHAPVCALLRLARTYGPVGSDRPLVDQARVLDAARLVAAAWSDDALALAPARIPLTGVHRLVYSASPGASSGKLGPLVVGRVTQEFVDDVTYINAVTVGPVTISVTARRQALDDTTLVVTFDSMAVSFWGVQVATKDITGGGTWKMLYAGTVQDDDGTKKLVRVMTTPSLFIIEQDV